MEYAEKLYVVPQYVLSSLNYYFISLLTKFEELFAFINEKFKNNDNYKLVSTKIQNFESNISKYDPFTIIIGLMFLCIVLKIAKSILSTILSTICI